MHFKICSYIYDHSLICWSCSKHCEVLFTDAPSLQKVTFNAKELTDHENDILSVQTRENESVTLACVFDSNPAPKVVWYTTLDRTKPLLSISLDSRSSSIAFSNGIEQALYISNFTIHSVQCEDFKTYMCSANNSLGPSTVKSVKLNVSCKLIFRCLMNCLGYVDLFNNDVAYDSSTN